MHDRDFPPKRRSHAGAKVAYGYIPSPDDPCELIPDPEMVDAIKEALDRIDARQSLREVAAWLTHTTGKKISHQGINRIWKERRGIDPKNPREKEQKKRRRAAAPKTSAEKAKARTKRKAADAKRILSMQQKKLENWDSDKEAPETPEAPPPVPATPISDRLDFDAEPEDAQVIFKPNEGPQTEFLAAEEQEVLYGGSAGGGKSYGLLADPMRYFEHPQFNGLILRRTNDELRELIWKSREIYPRAFPGATWQEKKSSWKLPAGGHLWMTYLERPEDVLRYQGQAFSYIAFDELTQHPTPFAWDYMRSRLRTTAADLPTFMRATTNPGGPGHGWVKRMFIDPAPPNEAFPATDIETGEILRHPEVYGGNHPLAGQPNPMAGKPLFMRRFIPASLYDNPYLMQDGAYEASLMSLPENQRRQLLEGDWSVAEGAAFSEFRPHIHIIEPFEIPATWRRFRACDYGYSSFSAVYWFAIDPAYETLVVYRELYVSKHTGRDLAKAILEAERGDTIDYGVLDSSCWHQRGMTGPTIAEEMILAGCRWRPSDRSAGARVAGKNRLHELLKVDPDSKRPGIVFFNTCRQIIADLPVIPADPKGSDDIDPRYASDHSYDAIRYGVMSRPRAFSAFDAPGGGRSSMTGWTPSDSIFGY